MYCKVNVQIYMETGISVHPHSSILSILTMTMCLHENMTGFFDPNTPRGMPFDLEDSTHMATL